MALKNANTIRGEKMSILIKLLIALTLTIFVGIFVWYAFFHSSATSAFHTLTYMGKELYSGKDPAVASSDGDHLIVYATPEGVMEYNTTTNKKTLLSSIIAVGLMFNGDDFFILDKNGVLTNATTQEVELLGVEDIHDTAGDTGAGFSITANGITSSTGSTTPAEGNYGMIQLVIT
jgi:hypothetical protein